MPTATNPLRLYLVGRSDGAGYSEPISFVVAAKSPARARRLVMDSLASEFRAAYMARVFTEGPVTYIGTAKRGTREDILHEAWNGD